jgi:hypothetical protein
MKRAMALRRVVAFAVDWLLIVLWGGVLLAAVMMVTGGNPPRPDNPWTAQTIGLLTMTLPVTLYFAACESSPMQASFGKRTLGLIVTRESGGRLSFGAAFVRNAVKFIPWECGHMVAQQAAFSGDAGLPPWVWLPAIVGMTGPLWWVLALMATGRTPYDPWTSSKVANADSIKQLPFKSWRRRPNQTWPKP